MSDPTVIPPPFSFRPAGWIPGFLEFGRRPIPRQVRLLASSALVGLAAGFGAIVFYIATRAVVHYVLGGGAGYDPSPPPGGEPPLPWLTPFVRDFRPWLLIVLPAIGGLVSGALVFALAPEAEGHGTDAVIAAYHEHDGRIRARTPLVKIVASAVTIGTGGSGGREGPIAQIGAGFGSLLADRFRLHPADRRILAAAGMGAGVAAIFRAPLAGALFASEVLYRSPEFEPEVIIPAGIASVVAYCVFGSAFGWQPLFDTPDMAFTDPLQLLPYLVLAVFMAVLASVYVRTFYGVAGLFHRWRVPRFLKPAAGALLTGALGVSLYAAAGGDRRVLSVLSFGYGSIQEAMTGGAEGAAGILLMIALGKILTTSLTIGSGGSGGVFGPAMVIGGCAGGALGIQFHRFMPAVAPQPASFVVLGMAGFFAAAAKTPFSTLVIVTEMTGGYHLLLPALWVCVLAYAISDERSIYRSQVESRPHSPAHRGSWVRTALADVKVGGLVKPGVVAPVLRPEDPLDVIVRAFDESSPALLPVVGADRRLQGVIDLDAAHTALKSQSPPGLIRAVDLMRNDVTPLTPDDPLDRALELFVENDLLALPMVDDRREKRFLGVVRRYDIAGEYLRRLHARRREETAGPHS